MSQYERLWQALARAEQPEPDDLAGSIQALPVAGELPSPWESWALIALVRHRQRQLWLGEIVASRLGGNLHTIGRMGAFGHPEGIPQQGLVPGMIEWEYYFHGCGCCLTHRVNAASIDVDFFGDCAEYFDTFFYANYLKSLRHPEPPEQRLIDLDPSIEPMNLAFHDLLAAGMLEPLAGRESRPFRVHEAVLLHEDTITSFCAAWHDPARRLWLAALLGDWPAAHKTALADGEGVLAELIGERVDQTGRLRRLRLQHALQGDATASIALLGFDDLGASELAGVLNQVFDRPLTGVTSTALGIVVCSDDPAWCQTVYRLFRRTRASGPIPQPSLWLKCLEFLLRHDCHRSEMIAALPAGAGFAETCLLALEYAPELALPLIRQALRSRIPINRTTVAAILALIDRPWSRSELLAALNRWDEQELTADCRAALLECHDEEAHRAVQAWEQRNPHEPAPLSFVKIGDRMHGPCISMGEIMLRNRAVHVRFEMAKLHDRVMRVRDRIPPEPPAARRPWWKLWGK
jgi:hypothetical protein